jgi:double-stranded RNA-binding protein Staufen
MSNDDFFVDLGITQQTAPTVSNPAIAPTQATSTTTNSANPDTPLEEQISETNLANTKEKTPMCLINELARYNKVMCICIYLFFFFSISEYFVPCML